MGCDIHLYIEHKSKESDNWWSFSYGQISISRSYLLFGVLANVRCEIPAEFLGDFDNEPKGAPKNLSWSVLDNYANFISDVGEPGEHVIAKKDIRNYHQLYDKDHVINGDWHSASWMTPSEFHTAVEIAHKYVDYGNQEEMRERLACHENDILETKRWVAYYEKYGINKPAKILDITIVDTILRMYEEAGEDARVVFWFDN